MATPTTNAGERDQAVDILGSGTLNATGATAWLTGYGDYNLVLGPGWTGSVRVEVTFDGGTTAIPLPRDNTGAAAVITASTVLPLRLGESGMRVRLNATLASGALPWRISR